MEHFESSHSDKIRYQPPPLKSAFPTRDGAVKNTQHLLITAWTKSSSTTFQEYLPDHRTNYLSKSHGFKTWFTAAKTKLFWGINQPVLCNSGSYTSSWLQGNNKKWWTLVKTGVFWLGMVSISTIYFTGISTFVCFFKNQFQLRWFLKWKANA